jgi:hypothetical protein
LARSLRDRWSSPTKELLVKKGRHRRFEEARSLKRSVATANRRCPECGAEPDDQHASWCMAESDEFDQILGSPHEDDGVDEEDPLAD